MAGVPAKRIGWVSEHGSKLIFKKNNIALCSISSQKYQIKDEVVVKV